MDVMTDKERKKAEKKAAKEAKKQAAIDAKAAAKAEKLRKAEEKKAAKAAKKAAAKEKKERKAAEKKAKKEGKKSGKDGAAVAAQKVTVFDAAGAATVDGKGHKKTRSYEEAQLFKLKQEAKNNAGGEDDLEKARALAADEQAAKLRREADERERAEQARRKEEEAAKRKAEEEAAAKKKAEEEAAKQKAAAEAAAKKKAEEEAAAKKKAEEEAAAKKKAEEEAAKKKAEMEAAAKRREEEEAAARKAEELMKQKAKEAEQRRPSAGSKALQAKIEEAKRKAASTKEALENSPQRSAASSTASTPAWKRPQASTPATPSTPASTPLKSVTTASATPVSTPSATPGKLSVKERIALSAGASPAQGDDDEFEEPDQRAIDAAKWVDKEINKVIAEIKGRGAKNSDGKYEIFFGPLFDQTANIFEALSGTLKTAKKYKVVSYDAEVLYQGANDKTLITLLKETHDGIEVKKRRKRKAGMATKGQGFGSSSLQNANAKCHVCGKTVYAMEFVGASDKAFHKNCFRCCECNTALKPTAYSTVNDKFYCPTHYQQLFLANSGYEKK